jgi:hypothetical protein
VDVGGVRNRSTVVAVVVAIAVTIALTLVLDEIVRAIR